jgi:hypothetical protein
MTSVLLLSLLACRDDGLVVYDTPPIVSIETPADGTAFFEGQEVLFTALVVSGSTASTTDLSTRWVANDSPICDTTEVPPDGLALCAATFTAEGEYFVAVHAVDPSGATADDTVTINIAYNNPPTVEIHSPVTGDVFGQGDLIVFEATLLDTEDEPTALIVTMNSNQDGEISGLPEHPSSAGDWAGGTDVLTATTHLITLTVTDSVGKTGTDTVTIQLNNKPSTPTVAIDPSVPLSGEALVAIITESSVDPEGDPITYRYDWYVNGGVYSSSNSPTVPLAVTLRGEYWEVQAYANDTYSDSAPGTASVTIGNAAPTLDSVTITPTGAGTDDELTCTPVGWYDPEGDAENYDYVWYFDGTVDTDETTNIFPAAKTTKGDELRCEVTPSDIWAIGDTVSSSTLTIQNTPPTQPVVIIDPTSPEPEDSLYCSISTASTDADGESIDYFYAWYVNGALTAETSNVLGADQTAHGDVVECEVTPSDGEDDGTAGTYVVNINDGTAPDPPLLDDPDPYLNEDYVDITGSCEADCDLTYYLNDATGSWTETGTCSSSGDLAQTVYLTRGYSSTAYATCTDDAGNTSGNSNTITMESCSIEDTYENTSGYGDAGADAINEWATMSDSDKSPTTHTITANALDTSDEDWYVFTANDEGTSDTTDDYNFSVSLTSGSSTYSFAVYRNDPTTPVSSLGSDYLNLSCTSSTYTEFEFGNYHTTAGYTCDSTNGTSYPDCLDYSATWYVQVTRNPSATDSCDHYELEVSNATPFTP